MKKICFLLLSLLCVFLFSEEKGVKFFYKLPYEKGKKEYFRVTIAIVDKENPSWIISQPVAGKLVEVNDENKGEFFDIWDGLDDNFMPVPPGKYKIKGIYMPAKEWKIPGTDKYEYHTLIPRYVGGVGDSFSPKKNEDEKFPWIHGAGFGYFNSIYISQDGIASLYHNYIENATNPFLLDLNREIGYEQIIKSFGSWGAAGGWATATDGEIVWCVCDNGGIQFVYRADGKKFGNGKARYRNDVYIPKGDVYDIACYKDEKKNIRYLYLSVEFNPPKKFYYNHNYNKNATEGNYLLIIDGEKADEIAKIDILHPREIKYYNGKIYCMHVNEKGNMEICSIELKDGIPEGKWNKFFEIKDIKNPSSFAVDEKENFYICDIEANNVYKLSSSGKILKKFGKDEKQKDGIYDHYIFMSPSKLFLWKDKNGKERLVVIEKDGPYRISEWDINGNLIREWFSPQFSADIGYCADPEEPEYIYCTVSEPYNGYGLVRYKIDYETGKWNVDAFWPNICNYYNEFPGGNFRPKIIHYNKNTYLCFSRIVHNRYGIIIYRKDGNNWIPSAGLISKGTENKNDPLKERWFKEFYWWSDKNGNGKLEEEEYINNPAKLPSFLHYWGETFLDDLTLTWFTEDEIWAIKPREFDKFGNPVYNGDDWKKIIEDPVLKARKKGNPPLLFGGNELSDKFPGDWQSVDGSFEEGFYINARGGKSFSANIGTQYKISYYQPDGKGNYVLKWRVGRCVFATGRKIAKLGEIYGTIFITKPVYGLLGVHDSCAGLYHVFTSEGLYVDTLFVDSFKYGLNGGVYFLGGENFSGYHYLNKKNGKVYVAMTTNQPCKIFEIENWKEGIIKPLEIVNDEIEISAPQIYSPPEMALELRKESGNFKIVQFYPSNPSFDFSMSGWEGGTKIFFKGDEKNYVEIIPRYNKENIFLRIHTRFSKKFELKDINPVERIFTHDRQAETVSFYFQSDPEAKGKNPDGREGDVRIIFGVFRENNKVRPVAVGVYPKYYGKENANPVSYISPVGKVNFEHAGELKNVEMKYKIDDDGNGFIILARIPVDVFKDSLPPAKKSKLEKFGSEIKTLVNFEATFGGHTKFWWANSDGSASIETYDEPSEARFYPGSWTIAEFINISPLVIRTWNIIGPFGFSGLDKIPEPESYQSRRQICYTFSNTKYPPEEKIDLSATYKGEITNTRRGEKEIKWLNVELEDKIIDFNKLIPNAEKENESVYYCLTYIYSPKETYLKFIIEDGYGHHGIRGYLNDEKLPVKKGTENPYELKYRIDTDNPFRINKGLNRLLLRYDHIWGEKKLCVKIDGNEEDLWELKISAFPMEQ
jgi:hypothetical protein